jgi:tRNA1(Val) A37 N6-methylase TrmN6
MTNIDFKHIFQQAYSFENWKNVLDAIFPRINWFEFAEKNDFPDDKITEVQQHGTISLADGRKLLVLSAKVAKEIKISRNRVQLRSIAQKYIDNIGSNGVLALFYSEDKEQKSYRFSFISKMSIFDENAQHTTIETQPKRFTYVLGEQESCTTAAQRFFALSHKGGMLGMKDIMEAFSVEKLNAEFFDKYKKQYEKFYHFLAKHATYPKQIFQIESNKDTNLQQQKEKPIRDFCKKLLGRIVFLQFLQKKGWMGCNKNVKMSHPDFWEKGNPRFLQDLFEENGKPNTFHSQILSELFFNTLNNNRTQIEFQFLIGGKCPFPSQKSVRVPYLNGGLFDEDEPYTRNIDFPPAYFAELLGFFDQYNFTIDENSPDDHEVGIDPEMLGRIFENLLEDNKDKGTFYTPKEIVQYMCQECLITYLHTHLSEISKEAIIHLIRYQKVTAEFREKKYAEKTNHLLNEVKICDPAIGSGAFPIGLLQEIFQTKLQLYPFRKTAEPFNPTEEKRSIIQNSIYGVDLEKGAVDIARLRFWLALVVEETRPQPLPNLDYKIMQGNSLLESFEGIDLSKSISKPNPSDKELEYGIKNPQIDIFGNVQNGQSYMVMEEDDSEYEKLQSKIEELEKEYFTAQSKTKKAEIHQLIDKLVLEHIDGNFEKEKEKLAAEMAILKNEYNSLSVSENDSKAKKERYEKAKSEYEKKITLKQIQIDVLAEKQKRLVEVRKAAERPYFLWHFYFKDVFDRGGFDIVIGNPPYVQLQKMGMEADMLKTEKYQTFVRTGDIYSLFYEKGFNLLTNKGLLCFITSNKWMRAAYGESTRQFFAKNTKPLLLIDFGNVQVFKSATVDTNILMLQKNKQENIDAPLAVRLDKSFIELKNLADYIAQNAYKMPYLNENAWVVGEKDIFDVKGKVESQGIPLNEWEIVINYGIKTGFNKAFVISAADKAELIRKDAKSEKVIKPLLRGRDISAWYPEYEDLWLIGTFPSLQLDIQDYPAILEHFLNCGKERLVQDGTGRKKTHNKWFETQDQIVYHKDFEKPKIIYPNMTKYMPFIYDEEKFYANQKCFIITGTHLKYLTCFFNSKLFKYCFSDNFPELQGGTREFSKVFLIKSLSSCFRFRRTSI